MRSEKVSLDTGLTPYTTVLLGALREMVAHAEIGIVNRPALRRAQAALAQVKEQQANNAFEVRL